MKPGECVEEQNWVIIYAFPEDFSKGDGKHLPPDNLLVITGSIQVCQGYSRHTPWLRLPT